jgi:tetratricopeptide (TPR) repeat protein
MASDLARLEMLVNAHPGLVLDDDEAEEVAAEAGDLDVFADEHAANARALVLCTYLYRKTMRFDEALETAERALALGRTFDAVTAAATVHRALDEVDEACALFAEAARIDPLDTSALIEGAKTLGAAERFPECEAWFARVLERTPGNAEAEMWHIYAGYAAAEPDDEPAHVERMRQFCLAHPEDEVAAGFLRQMAPN